jgi:hypothetical protein
MKSASESQMSEIMACFAANQVIPRHVLPNGIDSTTNALLVHRTIVFLFYDVNQRKEKNESVFFYV